MRRQASADRPAAGAMKREVQSPGMSRYDGIDVGSAGRVRGVVPRDATP